VMTVIDADGEPMEHALRATPDLVSPNSLEAEQLVGHEFRDNSDHVFGLYELCERGPREAVTASTSPRWPVTRILNVRASSKTAWSRVGSTRV